MTDEPTNDMLVHCGNCRHEWFALNTPILLHLAVERINKMRCPQCDELPSNIFCGPAPVDEINTSSERVKKTEKI